MFECITADDLNAWKERIILDVRPALPPTPPAMKIGCFALEPRSSSRVWVIVFGPRCRPRIRRSDLWPRQRRRARLADGRGQRDIHLHLSGRQSGTGTERGPDHRVRWTGDPRGGTEERHHAVRAIRRHRHLPFRRHLKRRHHQETSRFVRRSVAGRLRGVALQQKREVWPLIFPSSQANGVGK
jgi:hypothetical protein